MKKAAQWAAFSRLLRVLPEIRQGHRPPEGALAGTACGDRCPEQNFVGPPPSPPFAGILSFKLRRESGWASIRMISSVPTQSKFL